MPPTISLRGCLLLALLCPAVLLAVPTISTRVPAENAVVSSLTSVSVTFSEAVSGVDADDLQINGEAAANVTGSVAGPYVFTFTQPLPGVVSVAFDIDHGIAGLGTGAFAPTGWVYTLTDTLAPTIGKLRTTVVGQEMDALAPQHGSTVSELTQAMVTFSEDVTGVDASDLLVNGAATSVVTGSGSGPYVFSFTQPANGTVNFTWAGAPQILDTAGNAFAPSGTWSVTLGTLGTVVINEFLAANASGLADENGDFEDWIELHNPGATAVNLLGWSLSNDLDDPDRWVFPSRSIPAGGYLVVFASEKDRKPASGNLHANFKLNENGGSLGLFSPNEPRAMVSSFVAYPGQRFNYSYGLRLGELRYFSAPSPGSANPASTLVSVTPNPSVSVERGYFKDPFSLILTSSDASATIRYTLNGSDPTAASPAYTAPLNIAATTILRAAAFNSTAVPSETVTHSYVFLDNVVNQPSPPYDNPASSGDEANPALPTLSNIPVANGGIAFPISWGTRAVTPAFPGGVTNLPTNTVPADYGMDPEIYNDPLKYNDSGVVDATNGKSNMERIKQGLRDLPILSVVMNNDEIFGSSGLYHSSVVMQKTPLVEKRCSVELLLPDGTTGFATTCGIRIHGNASRNPESNPKHGFKLNFKGSYGATDLAYALFPDSPVEKFDDLILRADYNSSWLHWDNATQRPKGTRIRDAFCKDSFRAMGRVAGHHRYVHLFINGLYWGTYDPTEQENNGFAAAYFGGSKDDYDVYDQGILKSGSATAYTAMTAIASPIDNTKYEQMKTYLDVPWFIDYMLLHFYLGHQDWGDAITKNWYAVRNNKQNGKFKYLPWDMENLMWSETVDRTGVPSPPSGLHPKLVTNPQYLLDFADQAHKHLVAPDGALQSAACVARWNKWQSLFTNAMACESARWGDYRRDVHGYSTTGILYTWNGAFLTETNRLKNTYFPNRITHLTTANTGVLPQLRTRGLYPTLNAPEIRNNATNGLLGSRWLAAGTQVKLVLPAAVAGTTSAGTIYYTVNGDDPRVYYDTTGQRTPSAIAYSTPITLNQTTTIKARALNGTTWSALMEATFTVGSTMPAIVISEINYNPRNVNGGTAAEFVEVFNAGATDVELSRWSLDGIDFVFPHGVVLEAGNRLVIANNEAPLTFAAQYPGVQVLGYYGGSLSNSGERIGLIDAEGRTVFSVEYDDASPWPTSPDNGGYSLELIAALGDPQLASNWRASAVLKGTPGSANGTVSADIVIAEFCAQKPNTLPEIGFVELLNISGVTVDLSGWTLESTGGAVAFESGTTLAANARLTVPWQYDAVAGLRLPPGTNPSHGQLILKNATGMSVDGVRYGPQAFGWSFSRNGNAWQLSVPSPGSALVAASTAPAAAARINEWLSDPLAGEEDWLELYNTNATLPVVLTGMFVEVSGAQFQIIAPSAIAGNQWAQLFCDNGAQRADAVLLQLPATGATIVLKDSAGATLDSRAYGTQQQGISQGRMPDGTGATTTFPLPSPKAANHLALTNVPVLNEVLVRNHDGPNAPWARRPAWVELKNPLGTSVNLAGWKLRDPAGNEWLVPAEVTLAANGFLAIWSDPEQPASTAAALHLNCGLDLARSGGLDWYNPQGQIADRIRWGSQLQDRSIGRITDNSWALLAASTRGSANAAAAAIGSATSVKLNEWFPGIAELAEDFFEIYNPTALPVNLAGLWLGDTPSEVGRKKWQLPPLSFIDAQSYGLYTPDGAPVLGEIQRQTVPFSLASTGEYLRLGQNNTAVTAIDEVTFGSLAPGSGGRFPDGSVTIAALKPTPGTSNNAAPGPAILEQPVSLVRELGGSALFSITVLDPASTTYQWKRNGLVLPGEESSSLAIPVIGFSDEATYTCEVTDSSGLKISQPATLTVVYNYTRWAAAFGVGAGSDDADGDGASNFAEFLTHTNPTLTAGGSAAFSLHGFSQSPTENILSADILINRRAAFSELSGDLSADLGTWNATPPTTMTLLGTEPNQNERYRMTFSIKPEEPRMFLRLRLVP